MHLSCPTCGHECTTREADCSTCGASLLVALLAEDPGRSSAYSQLLEIHSGRVSHTQALDLWAELESYLELELEKFAGFPEFDWLDYREGIESVEQGLRLLLEAINALREGSDDLSRAEEGNRLLCRGRGLLLDKATVEATES